MSQKKRSRGRLRLLVVGGMVAVATATMVVVWTDDPVGAVGGSHASDEQTQVTLGRSAGVGGQDSIREDREHVAGDDQAAHPVTSTATLADTPSNIDPPEIVSSDADQSHQDKGEASARTGAAGSATVTVRVFFVREEKLVSVARAIPATSMVGTAALRSLLEGPSAADTSAGFTSAIPESTDLRSLSVNNGLATVDLDADFGSGGGTASMYLRLGQLVYTLTEFPTIDRVKIRINGADVKALGGEGLVIGGPLDRVGYRRLISGSPSADAGGPGAKVSSFKVYFVSKEALTAYGRSIPFTRGVGRAAVESLLAGPSSTEKAGGATTAIPAGAKVDSLTIKDGVATVDLSNTFASGGGSQSMYLRLGQIVYTLTQFPTVERVRFKVDGEVLTSLGGEGLLIERPLSRSDWAKIIGS